MVFLWQDRLPQNIEVICGVPRSGLMVAHMLALAKNLPVTDVEGLLQNRLIGGGKRLSMNGAEISDYLKSGRRILVVEDSVAEGSGINDARRMLQPLAGVHQLSFAAAYVTPEGRSKVDYAGEIVPRPRLFEWNAFQHDIISMACFDLDGVFCRDPDSSENDDGENYRRFISSVPLRYRPTRDIGWIVTSRLEKYREETERWLQKAGIRYKELQMLNLPDMSQRQGTNAAAEFKAAMYRKSGAPLFYESDIRQASEIARISGRFVLCTDTRELIGPGGGREVAVRKITGMAEVVRRKLKRILPRGLIELYRKRR